MSPTKRRKTADNDAASIPSAPTRGRSTRRGTTATPSVPATPASVSQGESTTGVPETVYEDSPPSSAHGDPSDLTSSLSLPSSTSSELHPDRVPKSKSDIIAEEDKFRVYYEYDRRVWECDCLQKSKKVKRPRISEYYYCCYKGWKNQKCAFLLEDYVADYYIKIWASQAQNTGANRETEPSGLGPEGSQVETMNQVSQQSQVDHHEEATPAQINNTNSVLQGANSAHAAANMRTASILGNRGMTMNPGSRQPALGSFAPTSGNIVPHVSSGTPTSSLSSFTQSTRQTNASTANGAVSHGANGGSPQNVTPNGPKYYALVIARRIGIFYAYWDDVWIMTDSFSRVDQQGFDTEEDAREYFQRKSGKAPPATQILKWGEKLVTQEEYESTRTQKTKQGWKRKRFGRNSTGAAPPAVQTALAATTALPTTTLPAAMPPATTPPTTTLPATTPPTTTLPTITIPTHTAPAVTGPPITTAPNMSSQTIQSQVLDRAIHWAVQNSSLRPVEEMVDDLQQVIPGVPLSSDDKTRIAEKIESRFEQFIYVQQALNLATASLNVERAKIAELHSNIRVLKSNNAELQQQCQIFWQNATAEQQS